MNNHQAISDQNTMNDVIHFFDPRPLYGVRQSATDQPCYPKEAIADERIELQDITLEPSGKFHLQVILPNTYQETWIADWDITEGEDGSVALLLQDGDHLIFPAQDRERVSNLFLKHANGVSGLG